MPEKFVDLSHYGFLVEPKYYFYGWSKEPAVLARRSVMLALKRAKEKLPRDHNFKIWDAYRSYETQKKMGDSVWKRLKLMHPKLDDEFIFRMQMKYTSGLMKQVSKLDSHRTGGALDLTIVDADNQPLYMGSDYDCLTERAALGYFDHKRKLSRLDKVARKNRLILKRAMEAGGFKSYPYEWWHWTYDK